MSDQAKTHWGNICFLFATGVLVALHIYKLAPALPAMRAELGMDLVTGGQLFSIINVVGMLFGVFAGGIADSLGHKRIIVWALVLVTLTSYATSLVDNQYLIMVLRLFEGIGFVAVTASAPSLIAGQSTEENRRVAMGVWGAYMPAGSVISMIFAPFVLDHFGWRGLWQVAALVSFVLFLLMLFWIGPHIKEHREVFDSKRMINNIRGVLARPVAWVIAILFGLYTFIFTGIMAWFPSYLIEEKGVDTVVAGSLVGLVVFMCIPGNLATGWIIRAGIKPWHIVVFSSLTMGVGMLGMLSESLPDTLRYGLCLLFSLFGGMWPASAYVHAMTVIEAPEQRGAMNGLLVNGSNMGSFFGPLALAAVVTAFGGWYAVAWGVLAISLLASVIAVGFRHVN